jgi:hypothetical protein
MPVSQAKPQGKTSDVVSPTPRGTLKFHRANVNHVPPKPTPKVNTSRNPILESLWSSPGMWSKMVLLEVSWPTLSRSKMNTEGPTEDAGALY